MTDIDARIRLRTRLTRMLAAAKVAEPTTDYTSDYRDGACWALEQAIALCETNQTWEAVGNAIDRESDAVDGEMDRFRPAIPPHIYGEADAWCDVYAEHDTVADQMVAENGRLI